MADPGFLDRGRASLERGRQFGKGAPVWKGGHPSNGRRLWVDF